MNALLLILSTAVATTDIDAARDSTLLHIQEGRWTQALEYAAVVIENDHDEYILLGLYHYAYLSDRISDIDPEIKITIDASKFEILRAWEDFEKLHENNINILNVLMTLLSQAYRTGAYEYARKVIELDSLNGYAQYILGHSARNEGDYGLAITNYLRAIQLDTSLHSSYSEIASIYLIMHEYDSSLAYYQKAPYDDTLSNSEHIGEIVCEIAKGNIEAAKALCDQLRQMETTWFAETSLNSLYDYIQASDAAKLTESDSFVILGPLIGGRIPLGPIEWIAVLTADTVDIVVDPVVEKPEPTSTPPPRYPASARAAGISGKSTVLAHIDADGTVLDVAVQSSSGNKDIDNAALNCVRKWRFEPARVFGVPIRYKIPVPIHFKLVH